MFFILQKTHPIAIRYFRQKTEIPKLRASIFRFFQYLYKIAIKIA